jgi:hypothetical protein
MPGGAAVAAVGAYSANKAAKSQSSAAKKAANTQQQSAQDSIAFQRESRDLAMRRLDPFINFATGPVNQTGTPATGSGGVFNGPRTRENFDVQAYLNLYPELRNPAVWDTSNKDYFDHWEMANAAGDPRQFTPNAQAATAQSQSPSGYTSDSPLGMLGQMLTPEGQMGYLKANPLFNIALDNVNRQSNNTFLGRGKVGDATGQLVDNAYLAGTPLLQNQTQNLFNAVNIGQASAAGQANIGVQTGSDMADTMEAAGNSRAAGIIGAGNAKAQGLYGIGNSLAQGIGAYGLFNNPQGAVNGGYVPTDYSGQTSGLLNGMSYGL